MAEQTTTSFYLFSFSHYILNDVDTSNCKAMISMIKTNCSFFPTHSLQFRAFNMSAAGVDSASDGNEYKEHFLGVKAAGA